MRSPNAQIVTQRPQGLRVQISVAALCPSCSVFHPEALRSPRRLTGHRTTMQGAPGVASAGRPTGSLERSPVTPLPFAARKLGGVKHGNGLAFRLPGFCSAQTAFLAGFRPLPARIATARKQWGRCGTVLGPLVLGSGPDPLTRRPVSPAGSGYKTENPEDRTQGHESACTCHRYWRGELLQAHSINPATNRVTDTRIAEA